MRLGGKNIHEEMSKYLYFIHFYELCLLGLGFECRNIIIHDQTDEKQQTTVAADL